MMPILIALIVCGTVCVAGTHAKEKVHVRSGSPVPIKLEDAQDTTSELNDMIAAARWAEAIAMACARLDEQERRCGRDHLLLVPALNQLAWLYQANGNLPQARRLYERVLAISEQSLSSDDPDIALCLNNLAALLEFQGDSEKAEPLYRRALSISETHFGPNDPQVASALNNLAVLLDSQGKIEEARELYLKSLKIREQNLGPDHPDIAITLNNLAALLAVQGDTDRAVAMLERSLRIRKKAVGDLHPDVSEVLNNLAMINRSCGKVAEGRERMQQAIEGIEQTLGPNHVDLVSYLNNLAAMEKQLGNSSACRQLVLRAAKIVDAHVHSILPTLSLAEQRAFIDSQLLDETSLLLRECGNDQCLTEAYELIFKWKGILIESLRKQSELESAGKDVRLAPLVAKLQEIRSSLADCYRKNRRRRLAEWQQQYTSLTNAKEGLERNLAVAAANLGLNDPLRVANLETFRKTLANDEIFVDVYKYDPSSSAHSSPVSNFCAVILDSSNPPTFVDLGDTKTIQKLISAWRQEVLCEKTAEDQWHRLTTIIWSPIAEKIPQNVRRVWLCLDGEVTRVPWQLFAQEKIGAETILVAEVDSARELMELKHRSVQISQSPQRLLLAGGVKFGEQSDSDLSDLQESMVEVERLSKLAKQQGLLVERFTGDTATRKAILSMLAGSDYCHLATHGFFVKNPKSRNLLIGSGIALCPSGPGDDGILTAEELVGFNLNGCKLVTISACNSGRGEEVTGQGVMGLRSCIMATGAKCLLISLWKIPDASTAKLMEHFYSNLWKRALPPIQCLREAQKALRDDPSGQFSAPVNWAGWTLVGNCW